MLLQLKIMLFMYISYCMYVHIYVLCIMYVYTYICIIWGVARTREKNKILKQTQTGAGEKKKMPISAFLSRSEKEKAPAFLQGLERSALYAIAACGCIGVKWREQCYNLRGVLLSRFGYNITRICPDSYKAGAFRHFRQHRKRSRPARGPVAPRIFSSFAV